MQIGIDIDEVIYPFIQQFRYFVRDELRVNASALPDPVGWAFASSWGLTEKRFDELFEQFILEEGFKIGKPIEGSVEMIAELARENDITFITARGTFSGVSDLALAKSKMNTIQWLHAIKLTPFPIVFTKNKHLLNVEIHVDDAYHHLTDCRERGIFSICMDAPHNQEWDGPRAKTPSDVISLIQQYKWQKQALGSPSKELSLLS